MLSQLSIKDLYSLALAEGEGMGTAYEYFVKRQMLTRLMRGYPPPRTVLIAGLPEKYGSSLDFLRLGREWGASVTVIDERPAALEKLVRGVVALKKQPGGLEIAEPASMIAANPVDLQALTKSYDLVLSSEVIQRFDPSERAAYVARLRQLSSALVLFCPNAENQAHNSRSGLGGLTLAELKQLVATGNMATAADYIDMPPFPPGITRSAEQRDEATSGKFEALFMWGLGRYAQIERFIPVAIRRRQAHIVYAVAR